MERYSQERYTNSIDLDKLDRLERIIELLEKQHSSCWEIIKIDITNNHYVPNGYEPFSIIIQDNREYLYCKKSI